MADKLEYDVVIVGAGPAGLAAAIRYAQLCNKANKQPKVCVVEKGAAVGAHILSGAVFNPRALNELLPNWAQEGAPVHTRVTSDKLYFLSEKKAWPLPVPPPMRNTGNYIISLSLLCRWLAQQAEQLGVEIYPGFAATQLLFNENSQQLIGIKTGERGRDKLGAPKANFQAGVEILAKQTLLAEGCRGSLSQQLIQKFSLDQNSQPQTYGLGIKELWQIDPKHHRRGTVQHTIGWPLDPKVYGGSFIYHWDSDLLSIGLVVGLDYENPYFSPYEEFQRFKQHPFIRSVLSGGRCLSYGARTLNEGGWQSLPKLSFAGGMLIGCSAGFLNVPQLKGSHYAMKSGMLAAETVFTALQYQAAATEFTGYQFKIEQSWLNKELYLARNIRPAFRWGLWAGLAYSVLDTYLFFNRAPWTFTQHHDHRALKAAVFFKPIIYPKHDGIISFDKMTSVARSGVFHEENQPVHLILRHPAIAITINWHQYAGPEQRYCPAGVYEFIGEEHHKKLQINAANCIHCKACDVKDPTENITWTPPEGGGGPSYNQL